MAFMAFSDFKSIAQVQKEYRIICKEDQLIINQNREPSARFLYQWYFYFEITCYCHKLEHHFLKHLESYTIDQVNTIFAMLDSIFQSASTQSKDDSSTGEQE